MSAENPTTQMEYRVVADMRETGRTQLEIPGTNSRRANSTERNQYFLQRATAFDCRTGAEC
jgi:hypothetical protein